jgi:hypothetical protein
MPDENQNDAQAAPVVPLEPRADKADVAKAPRSRGQRLKDWYISHKKLSIPLSVLAVILILGAVPWTRYYTLGLFMKRDVVVYLIDDGSKGTIYGGYATLDGKMAGAPDHSPYPFFFPKVPLGKHVLEVGAAYYGIQTKKINVDVAFSGPKKLTVSARATGRLVTIRAVDKITGQGASGIRVKSGKSEAKTDWKGDASLVLAPSITTAEVELSSSGYNAVKSLVKITPAGPNFNIVSVTPTGSIYYLSNQTGKIDVMKANLDGTNPQVVLAGTGNEQGQSTVLMASRDWKYLALLSRRAGNTPTLYLINTSNDNLSTIESGNASFNMVGWLDDNFTYTVTRGDVQLWQTGRQVLKSFDATAKKTTALDQTTASGSDNFDYVTEQMGQAYTYNGQIFYIKNWTAGQNSANQLNNDQATLNSIKPDGSAKKAIRSFGLASGAQAEDITVEEKVKSPGVVELKFSDGSKDNFYVYANGQVKEDTSTTSSGFYSAGYPSYLLSPSTGQTFWSEPRNGKNTLFVGDQNGQSAKQIASLSDYSAYGWYTDNYLLVSKSAGELYIMSKGGSVAAVKVSDYYNSPQNLPAYSGL